MADVSTKRLSPLDGVTLASTADAAARIEELAPRTRLIVRGRPAVAAAAEAALGLALPQEACRAASAGDVTALWLGPDEWLVLAPAGREADLAARLGTALASVPHAVIDVSHRNCAIALSGPKAAYVLAHGLALDLDLPAFPVGMCTRTLVGRTEAVVWRLAEDRFHIEVWRSFARYLVGFLDEARREFA